jgi:uncharacterized membrane protein YeaQ/YmgE (transglycosylase-associated protein family)
MMEGIVAGSEQRNQADLAEARHEREGLAEAQHERWAHVHVNWTAVWIGALAVLSMVVLFGLVGTALGAHLLGPEHRIVDMKKLGIWTLIFSVCGAFFSSVVGGWVATKIAGILHSEPAMLHGAFVWLLTVPILVVCAGLGASSLFGGWYGGLGPNSAINTSTPFVHPDPLGASATSEEIAAFKTQLAEYNRNVKQWHEDTPKVTRNSALGAIMALLLALLGSVIGGWMASGEPMNFTHHLTRKPRYHTTA